jgi:hypothetical protein
MEILMINRPDSKSPIYLITVQGKLDDSWQIWFAGFSFSSEPAAQGQTLTTLTGEIPDQAALRGLLNKLWDLNLSLWAVRRAEAESWAAREA